MNKTKVSVVIPLYKPDEAVLKELKKVLMEQTIKPEIVENWNMPEAISMNTGIKKSKGEIIVTLAQDCIPTSKDWLEKLIEPLNDKDVVVSVSDLILPEYWWKKYPFLTKILTIKELEKLRPVMDARACAYRKKDLMKVGLFSEDPKVIGIDSNLYMDLKKIGKTAHTGVSVYHVHPLTNGKKLKMIYNYSEANGKSVKQYGKNIHSFFGRIIRAIPVLGLIPIVYMFPYKKLKFLYLLPIYLLAGILEHAIWVYGFWNGFFFDKESMRNKEVLIENKSNRV